MDHDKMSGGMRGAKYPLLFGVPLIIMVPVFIIWPNILDGDPLGPWASLVTILSLVIVPITYFYKQYEKRKQLEQQEYQKKYRTAHSMYREIWDALEAIKGDKYPENLLDAKFDDKKFTFTCRLLNHDVYDSLVYSGGILFLDYELQQQIQDIFNRIKYHNHHLKQLLDELKDAKTTNTVRKHCMELDNSERLMLKDIPRIMVKLEKRFGLKSLNQS